VVEIPFVTVKNIVVLTGHANKGQRLLKIDYPYYGREYIHGGGKQGTEIQDLGGHRLCHCVTKTDNPGYELVIPQDVPVDLRHI